MSPLPPFVWQLIDRLRRRGLVIGVDDCAALRTALAAGLGLRSDEALRNVCISLWAKSTEEAELIATAFDGLGEELPRWSVDEDDEWEDEEDDGTDGVAPATPARLDRPSAPTPEALRAEELGTGVSPLPDLGGSDTGLFLTPRFPLPAREIAQVWRRLNRPSRTGQAIEVDATATLDRLARSGVATPPVVVPRRGNQSTLLILLDRDGSMSPYHGFIEHVVQAIGSLGRLSGVTVRYFHDVPGTSPDRGVLAARRDRLNPRIDDVLGEVRPLPAVRVYRDPRLVGPDRLEAADLARFTSAVVVSDAGAARGRYDGDRLVDTVALGRLLRRLPRCTVAWLNPVPPRRWAGTTADQVGRHLPMFPLTRFGMTLAVDALRGRPPALEHPL